VGHFSGNHGRGRGAHSSQTRGRGNFSFPSLFFVMGSNLYIKLYFRMSSDSMYNCPLFGALYVPLLHLVTAFM
jgi:hypothetical protein